MEYLINVALTFAPKLIFGLALWFIASLIMKRLPQFKGQSVYKQNSVYLGVFLAVALVLSATSPSITYKHETFDKDRESYQIQLLNQQEHERTDLVIEDRTREDYSVSDEEWKDKSSYEKGTKHYE